MKMEKWINKFIGGVCSVYEANMFCFMPDDEVITFTYDEPTEANSEWKKFLKESFNFDLTNENVFTMSILHELGHHYTVDLFTDEEWTEQATEKALENVADSEYCQAYFNLPIEKKATEYAVSAYKQNETAMRKWNHRFNCAIRHYEKTHKIKSSLLTKF